jgi:hypothetical protein
MGERGDPQDQAHMAANVATNGGCDLLEEDLQDRLPSGPPTPAAEASNGDVARLPLRPVVPVVGSNIYAPMKRLGSRPCKSELRHARTTSQRNRRCGRLTRRAQVSVPGLLVFGLRGWLLLVGQKEGSGPR